MRIHRKELKNNSTWSNPFLEGRGWEKRAWWWSDVIYFLGFSLSSWLFRECTKPFKGAAS